MPRTPSQKEQARLEAFARLREWLKPGDTVYTILRSVSRSGMQRTIGLVVFRDGRPLHPNHAAATVLDWRVDRQRDGVKVNGCGMDMGFHLVSTLSSVLFPIGFRCIGLGCPSNDHAKSEAVPHWHRHGEYALRQEWL